MPAITIRDVPDHVRDELAARAARSGRSLQEYLLHELKGLASVPDPDDWLGRVRRRARAVGADLAIEDLVADKDADRK
jgi:antitoxin FitA